MLLVALAVAAVGFIGLISLRWPILALFAFVALIPVEQVILVDGLGTMSRLAGILFAVTYGVPRIGRFSLGLMSPAAWLFLAWAFASLGWAIDPSVAWGELTTLLQLFLIALLVADLVSQDPTKVRPIMWVYSISAAATACVGIVSFLGYGPAGDVRAAALQDQNPAQFAAVLLPALIFGLFEALDGEQRLLGAAIALATSIAVIVSGTRGAWVSIAVVVAIFVLPRLTFRRQVGAIAMIAVICVVALQIPGVASLISDRAATAVVSGGAGRTDIWTVGVSIYESAPVLGVGYANFPVAYTGDAVRASGVSSGHGVDRGPHNLVIGTMTELGAIGLFLLALFLLPLVLQRGWGPDAAMIQSGLASLLLLALFLDIVGNRKQVWLMIGIAAGLAYVRRRANTPNRSAPDFSRDPGMAGIGGSPEYVASRVRV